MKSPAFLKALPGAFIMYIPHILNDVLQPGYHKKTKLIQ